MSDFESTPSLRFADVAEAAKAAISAYARALDDGRTDDLVELFCADGTCEIPGAGRLRGHDQLRAAFATWVPRRPQRHLVLNTLITEWDQFSAHATSDLTFIVLGKAGWAIQLVGRYDDVLRLDEGSWRFQQRVATFVTAEPSA
jgi:SnoaL-like domain